VSSVQAIEALRNVIASRGSVRVGRALVSYDGRTFGVSAKGVSLSTRNRAKAADFIATIA
jgi:hypothetical protein